MRQSLFVLLAASALVLSLATTALAWSQSRAPEHTELVDPSRLSESAIDAALASTSTLPPSATADAASAADSNTTTNSDTTTISSSASATGPLAPGIYPMAHPAIEYSGVWTFGPRGADIGWLETSDSRLAVSFAGDSVALILNRADYVAFLYVQVDGQSASALPADNRGNSIIVLRSGDLQPRRQVITVATGLGDGIHRLEVIADRGWDRYALAGIVVGQPNPAQRYVRLVGLGVLSSVIAAVALLVSLWPWLMVLHRAGYPSDTSRLPHQPERQSDTQVADEPVRVTSTRPWHWLMSGLASLLIMLGLLMSLGNPATMRAEAGSDDRLDDRLVAGGALAVSGLLLLAQPGLLLTVTGLLILFVLVVQRLHIGLALTIFYAPFFLFPLSLNQFAFPMAEVMVLLTFAAFVLRSLLDWAVSWRAARSGSDPATAPAYSHERSRHLFAPAGWRVTDLCVLLWLMLGLASYLWAQNRGLVLTEWRELLLEPALFYIVLRSRFVQLRHLRSIVVALVTSGLLVCLIGLALYATGNAITTAEAGARRLASVYGSPNNVALLLMRCLPFALAAALLLKHRWRIVAAAVVMVMLLTVALTQSAGAALFGLPAVVLTVLLMLYGRRALRIIVPLALVGCVLVVVLLQVSPRFASLLDTGSGTNFIRLRLWESSFDILRQHPVSGIGLDQFLDTYRGTFIRPDAIFDQDLSHPHNIVFDFWLRLGLAGVVGLCVAQVAFWRSTTQVLRDSIRLLPATARNGRSPADSTPVAPTITAPLPDEQTIDQHAVVDDGSLSTTATRILLAGATAAMAGLLAHGLIDNSVFVKDLAFIFVLLLGMAVRLGTASPSGADHHHEP